MWQVLSGVADPPRYLVDEGVANECFAAREYVSGAGYSLPTNSEVQNFKKCASRRENEGEWHYRDRAVRLFARELASLIADNAICVSWVPSSIPSSDPEYSRRFEDMLQVARQTATGITVVEPIRRSSRVDSMHSGGSRSIDRAGRGLEWIGFGEAGPPQALLVVDDVVTTGASFCAYRRLLLSNAPRVQVYGAFWARTVSSDPNLDGFNF